ncbi:DUF3800 domain-containing protein [Pedobacter sp. D749]|uniref:DUF3800 domain-containing protein n=1 Tax=Pedobacter sp. D749 TaxID=2856523 RepID=UPI001C58AD1E|nr:DUF3800 domain-containing protein [Pedobacter sp. D749]QXU43623.1 DUF3800 domain-containing protein [Pedobacter sp. D749]
MSEEIIENMEVGAEAVPKKNIKKKLTKEEKEAKALFERKLLIDRVASGTISTVKDKVAFILNNHNEARNSDIKLAYIFWRTFEEEKLDGKEDISVETMLKLTKQITLSRWRAKIQYDYKLFLADEDVQISRGKLQGQYKREALDHKPANLPLYQVFIDETGKNEEYLSVGSIWLLGYNPGLIIHSMEINDWKKRKKIEYEFHFSKLSKHKLEDYKDFFRLFISKFPDIGFKVIVLKSKGLANKNEAIVDLTFHLLHKGIIHEHESKRAPLPRMLQVRIDDEELGSDTLKLENIKERISGQKVDGLHLDVFEAVSSAKNHFIQAVDLFTGAVNRKLNFPGEPNFKDEFAEFIFDSLGFDITNLDSPSEDPGTSIVFNLSAKNT